MLWLLYVSLSALFFGLGNIVEKILVSKYVKDSTIFGYTVLTYFGYSSFLFLFLPFIQFSKITPIILLLICIRALLNLMFYYFWIKLMLKEEISRIIGILFVYTLIAVFFDYLLYSTKVSLLFYIGALLLILSSILMSYKPSKESFIEKKDIMYLTAIIIIWGFYGILLKSITNRLDHIPTFLFLETASVLIAASIVTFSSKRIQNEIKTFFPQKKLFWAGIILVNLFYLIGLLTSFKAYDLQLISYVAPFESLQPTFVFIIALVLSLFFPAFLKEETDKKTIGYKIAALILLVIGIFLIL